LARGFELLKGNYVQITEEGALFGTSKGAEKPYRLVAETLDKTGRVAIAQTVFHENEASSLFAPCETV
jgi:non-homologous end joining protein Ku